MNGQKVSIVDYSVKYEPTPFGERFLANTWFGEEDRKARFALTDNGWTLERR